MRTNVRHDGIPVQVLEIKTGTKLGVRICVGSEFETHGASGLTITSFLSSHRSLMPHLIDLPQPLSDKSVEDRNAELTKWEHFERSSGQFRECEFEFIDNEICLMPDPFDKHTDCSIQARVLDVTDVAEAPTSGYLKFQCRRLKLPRAPLKDILAEAKSFQFLPGRHSHSFGGLPIDHQLKFVKCKSGGKQLLMANLGHVTCKTCPEPILSTMPLDILQL